MADEIFENPFVDVEEEDIRGRVFDEINALFPGTQAKPDNREGSLIWTITAPYVKEVARFYSDLFETLQLGFLQFTRGDYLDAKAVEIGLTRKPAAASKGDVRFFGVDGVVVPVGTTISTSVDAPEEEALSFETDSLDEDGNPVLAVDRTIVGIADPIAAPTAVSLGLGGGITGDAVYRYTYITALSVEEPFYGETLGSPASAPLSLSGEDVELTIPSPPPTYVGLHEIIGLRVYRALDTGSGYSNYKLVGTVSGDLSGPVLFTDDLANINFTVTLDIIPLINTTGYVDIASTAITEGKIGNIAAKQIQFLDDPVDGVLKVTNQDVFSGGADIESDEEFRERLIEEIQKPPGAGNVSDYIGWAKSVVGVDSAFVVPEWEAQFGIPNGPGTVKVVVSGPDNTLINFNLVENVREYIAGDIGLESPYSFYAGVTQPSAVVQSTGGDIDDGQYHYVYSFVNVGGGETPHNAIDNNGVLAPSQILEVSVSAGTGAARVVLSNILSGPTGQSVENTIRRRIYRRNLGDPDPKYYLVGQINDNFTTNFVDTIADADVGLRYAPVVNSTSLFNGQAPIGAHVTVESISKLTIRVEATIIPLPGYNLNGTGGNLNLGDLIKNNLAEYFNGIEPGETIYFVDVQNAIHDSEGVKDFRNTVVFTPDFPFGTTENIENPDKTVKPVYDPSGILTEAPE